MWSYDETVESTDEGIIYDALVQPISNIFPDLPVQSEMKIESDPPEAKVEMDSANLENREIPNQESREVLYYEDSESDDDFLYDKYDENVEEVPKSNESSLVESESILKQTFYFFSKCKSRRW